MLWMLVVACFSLAVLSTGLAIFAVMGLIMMQRDNVKLRRETDVRYVALAKACETSISSLQSAFTHDILSHIPSSRLPQV